LIFLNKHQKECVSIAEIAQAEKIPRHYLEKIISKLEKAGIVQSRRGAYGGYLLAKPFKKITVKNFLEILEGEAVPVQCVSGLKCPLSKKCAAKNVWARVKKEVEGVLNRMSLEDLI